MRDKTVRELSFLFVDNELDGEVLISFRQRVETCPDCARETRYARRFLTVVRERCSRESAPGQLRRSILEGLPHRRNQDR